MRLNQELIEEWWRERRDGGIYRSDRSIDDPAWDRAIEVDRFVSESAASADDLPTVLMLLVQGAASDEELAFIGTTQLENAFHSGLGEAALAVLDSLPLTEHQRDTILSGFQR